MALPDKAFSDQNCTKCRLATRLHPNPLWELTALSAPSTPGCIQTPRLRRSILGASPHRVWRWRQCSGSSFFAFEHWFMCVCYSDINPQRARHCLAWYVLQLRRFYDFFKHPRVAYKPRGIGLPKTYIFISSERGKPRQLQQGCKHPHVGQLASQITVACL